MAQPRPYECDVSDAHPDPRMSIHSHYTIGAPTLQLSKGGSRDPLLDLDRAGITRLYEHFGDVLRVMPRAANEDPDAELRGSPAPDAAAEGQ